MNTRPYIILIITFFISASSQGQQNSSFSKKYSFNEDYIVRLHTCKNKNNFHGIGSFRTEEILPPHYRSLFFLNIDIETGLANEAFEFFPTNDSLRFSFLPYFGNNNNDNDDFFIADSQLSNIYTGVKHRGIYIGNSSGNLIGKRLPYNVQTPVVTEKGQDLINLFYGIPSNTTTLSTLNLMQVNPNGEMHNSFGITVNYPNTPLTASCIYSQQDTLVLTAQTNNRHGTIFSVSEDNFLFKTFKSLEIYECVALNTGNIIVIGREYNDLSSNIIGGYINTPLIVIKLNSNLETLWAKSIYFSPNISYQARLAPTHDGGFFITKSDLSSRIHTNLVFDSAGNLIQKRGIPIGYLSTLNEQGGAFLSSDLKYDDITISENEVLIAKLNQNFNSTTCETYDNCLEISDFEYEYFDFDFFLSETNDTLIPIDLITNPISVQVQDHCETTPPPTAEFIMADSICRADCLAPTPVLNATAEAVRWHLSGPQIDTTVSVIEDLCLNITGEYELTQTIWFFGCTESFSKSFTVVPDLEIGFNTDSLLCAFPPFSLRPIGSRELREFTWQDSSNTANFEVYESGNYTVTASDGYCTASGAINLYFPFEEGFVPQFSAGADTSICDNNETTLTLRPFSNFADVFNLNENTDSLFDINAPGQYVFSVSQEDCIFYDTIQINPENCQAEIYLPTAFSPDYDGINDTWKPLGNKFICQKISVFDRWGNLLFKQNGAEAAWDGKVAGADADIGVYVIVVDYLNSKTGLEDSLAQDVLLLR